MKKAVAAIAFALLLLLLFSLPAMAYDVTKDDFKQPPSVTVTIDGQSMHPNLQNGVLFVNHVCYGGEKVSIVYVIEPSSTTEGTTIAGRSYTISTQLSDNTINAYAFRYSSENTLMSAYPIVSGSDSVTLNLPGVDQWEYGYGEINITVSGKIPSPNERLVRLKALSVEVQGAPSDCLPPVVIPVVNKAKFQSDINSAKSKYDELKSELNKYLGQVDTSSLSSDLKKAGDNLTAAETLFNNGDYVKADEKLNATENWLNKSENDLKKVKAEYMCKEAQDKANEINNLINEISAYVDEIDSGAVKMSISEKIQIKAQFKEIQNDYSNLLADISAVKAAIDNGMYDDAIARANNTLSYASKVYDSANSLLNTLQSKIATPSNTPTATPTSQGINMPSFSLNPTTLAIIGGIVVATIVIAVLLYMRGGGRFDELR